MPTTTFPLKDEVSLRLDYQERKRQQNIENITSIAAANLIRDEDVPEQKPDEDWITRFFSSAQEVSSETIQDLWVGFWPARLKGRVAIRLEHWNL